MEDWINQIKEGNRRALSKAITVVESSREEDHRTAVQLLKGIQEIRRPALKIGITGSPGVGKSSFINTFISLMEAGYRVAILTIDPSSEETGGSILGDKVRMNRLTGRDNIFIRPSPSKGVLGGIGSHTWKSVHLCEAARYDLIVIETVGVGQSEIEIQYLSDEVWWLTMPGAGDEIQGMKKGIMEIADRIIVTKTDLDPQKAKLARIEIQRAIHTSISSGREPAFYEVSALHPDSMTPLFQDFQNIKPRPLPDRHERYWFEKQWQEILLEETDRAKSIRQWKEEMWNQIITRKTDQWDLLERWKHKIRELWKKEP